MASFGELDRVRQQVAEHLAQSLPVSEQLGRGFGVRLDGELQSLLRGERLERGLDILQQHAETEPLDVDVHPARLDLGQVKNVVDELQQV